ncbi:MAG: asparagine synthase-related protein, partial [bacterium]|nr:asparagine synthase-related protein [bacterium]
MTRTRAKLHRLQDIVREMGSVLIAFSGGVDSSFLLRVARDVLGDRAAALTALSPTYPEHELEEAKRFAAALGVQHILIESNELKITNFARNDTKRCYYCKSELFALLRQHADSLGFTTICDGANVDDTGDFRPGL